MIHAEDNEYDELQRVFKDAGIPCKRERKMTRSATGKAVEYLEIQAIMTMATVILGILLAIADRFQKKLYYRKEGKEMELDVQNYKAEDAAKILGDARNIIIKKKE